MLVNYWCTVCAEVHTLTPGSEEQVYKTGWTFVKDGTINVSGERINIGFCNGTHSEGRPKHLCPAGITPEFKEIER
jgi:hypothetical protein